LFFPKNEVVDAYQYIFRWGFNPPVTVKKRIYTIINHAPVVKYKKVKVWSSSQQVQVQVQVHTSPCRWSMQCLEKVFTVKALRTCR
jgi:hypothetical protein